MQRKKEWRKRGNTTDPSKPYWNEYENEATGKRSLSIHTPQKITNFENCDHYFVPDANGNVQCKKCTFGTRIAWGLQIVRMGKIIDLQ